VAVQFIRDHRNEPFFLFLSYGPPHMPVAELPDRYRSMYDPVRVLLRDNVWNDGKLAYHEDWFKIYMWDFQYYDHRETFPHDLPTGMNLRDLTALYYGQITAVDDCLGQVLEALKDTGLEQDTIVLFTSDHGDLLGSHQLFNKNRHYDEATRVPMVIRYPRLLKPAVIDQQIATLVDATPTLLDLCGVPVPDSVQGTSLAPVLLGRQRTLGENAAFIETSIEDGVRTHRYLYSVEHKKPRREHLFDCEADPMQMNDLANDPSHADALKSLRQRVQAWRDRTSARVRPGPPAAPAASPG
jgi:arylsulfatase A-like enzyme